MISQVGLSMLLLAGTGLFVRSLAAAHEVVYGVDTHSTYIASVEWPRRPRSAPNAERRLEWMRRERLLSATAKQLRGEAGIASAAIVAAMPFRGADRAQVHPWRAESDAGARGVSVLLCGVGASYFATVRTALLRGREFGPGDDDRGTRVAILGQSLASRLWPTGDAIGRCLAIGSDSLPCAVVVGVAEDVRDLRGRVQPTLYVPIEQALSLRDPSIVVRPAGGVGDIGARVHDAIFSIAPEVEYVDVTRLQALIEPQLKNWELGSVLFGVMSILALVVAAIGLFGVVSTHTASRTRELGIRRALGASPGRILRLILKESLLMASGGILMGAGLVLEGRRWITPFLFTAHEGNPAVLTVAAAILLVVAAGAALVPAVRVNRRPPADALRAE